MTTASAAKKPQRSTPTAPATSPKPNTPTRAAKSGKADAAKKVKPEDKSKAPTIGGDLDSLDSSMKGPLDSLIETEALEASPFDDPMGGSLGPAAPKKFKLRRWIRNLFRRNKSKVVTIKATDPRKVKIVLFRLGASPLSRSSRCSPPPGFSRRPIREIFLPKPKPPSTSRTTVPPSNSTTSILSLIPSRRRSMKFARCASWPTSAARSRRLAPRATGSSASSVSAQKQVKALLPSPPSDVLRKVGVALGEIAEGVAKQTQAKPDADSVGRLRAITDLIEGEIFMAVRPTEMLEGVNRILKQCRQEVEGKREIQTTVNEIRAAVDGEDPTAAYASYHNLTEMFPDLADDARVTEAMKDVSALEQKAVRPGEQSLEVAQTDRPSDLIAAVPLAVQPVRGDLASGQGKLRFVVERGDRVRARRSVGQRALAALRGPRS